MSGMFRISLAPGEAFAFASWRGAFAAKFLIAGDGFSPNASTRPYSSSVHAGQAGSIA
jgi:hypothetical protein